MQQFDSGVALSEIDHFVAELQAIARQIGSEKVQRDLAHEAFRRHVARHPNSTPENPTQANLSESGSAICRTGWRKRSTAHIPARWACSSTTCMTWSVTGYVRADEMTRRGF